MVAKLRGVWITSLAVFLGGCLVGVTVTEDLPAGDAGSEGASQGEDDGPPSNADDSSPESEEAGDGAEQGADFVPEPEPDPNAELRCNPLAPDDCEAGHKCNLVRVDSEWIGLCVPLADEVVGRGEPCEALDEAGADTCESGTVCWDIMNGAGTCLSFCDLDQSEVEQCGEDFICNWGKSLEVGVCTPTCSPLSPDDCPATCGCYWANTAFLCLPRASDLGVGVPCSTLNDCAPGNLCVAFTLVPGCDGAGSFGCCTNFCELASPSCVEGAECAAFFEPGSAPPGHEQLGACVVPDA